MSRLRNVLVGVDLHQGDRLASFERSPATRAAVEKAIWLAARTGSRLTFCSVLEISYQAEHLLEQDELHLTKTVNDAADEVLGAMLEEARAQGVEAEKRIVYGTSWYELIRLVIKDKFDLVVAGTRNKGAAERMLFGSTATRLLRKCPCPVWVTKPSPIPEQATILVASDLSPVSEELLQMVVTAAQNVDARVHLLHALEYVPDQPAWYFGLNEEQRAEQRAKRRAEAEAALHEQLSRTDYRTLTHGVKVHLIDGTPHDVILNFIEQEKVDLLAMGTVGRSGIPGFLIGNIAERLLQEVPCSVLAVKAQGFVSPVTAE